MSDLVHLAHCEVGRTGRTRGCVVIAVGASDDATNDNRASDRTHDRMLMAGGTATKQHNHRSHQGFHDTSLLMRGKRILFDRRAAILNRPHVSAMKPGRDCDAVRAILESRDSPDRRPLLQVGAALT